ncbi:hypothetical protein B0H19DRAFT_1297991 [Mycena capillaripes]|nr:hypothetical protein B0H19DRAFT_1297991 [Mycena capillaripes]
MAKQRHGLTAGIKSCYMQEKRLGSCSLIRRHFSQKFWGKGWLFPQLFRTGKEKSNFSAKIFRPGKSSASLRAHSETRYAHASAHSEYAHPSIHLALLKYYIHYTTEPTIITLNLLSHPHHSVPLPTTKPRIPPQTTVKRGARVCPPTNELGGLSSRWLRLRSEAKCFILAPRPRVDALCDGEGGGENAGECANCTPLVWEARVGEGTVLVLELVFFEFEVEVEEFEVVAEGMLRREESSTQRETYGQLRIYAAVVRRSTVAGAVDADGSGVGRASSPVLPRLRMSCIRIGVGISFGIGRGRGEIALRRRRQRATSPSPRRATPGGGLRSRAWWRGCGLRMNGVEGKEHKEGIRTEIPRYGRQKKRRCAGSRKGAWRRGHGDQRLCSWWRAWDMVIHQLGEERTIRRKKEKNLTQKHPARRDEETPREQDIVLLTRAILPPPSRQVVGAPHFDLDEVEKLVPRHAIRPVVLERVAENAAVHVNEATAAFIPKKRIAEAKERAHLMGRVADGTTGNPSPRGRQERGGRRTFCAEQPCSHLEPGRAQRRRRSSRPPPTVRQNAQLPFLQAEQCSAVDRDRCVVRQEPRVFRRARNWLGACSIGIHASFSPVFDLGKEPRSGRVQKAWARISFSRGAWRRICVGVVEERLVGGAGRRRSCIRSLTVTSILLPTKVQGGVDADRGRGATCEGSTLRVLPPTALALGRCMVHGKEHRSGRVQKVWARISFSRGAWRRICVGAVGERLVGGAGRRRSCIRSLTVTSILLPTKVQGGLNVAPFIERGSRQVLMEQLAPFKAVMDLDGAKAGNVGYGPPWARECALAGCPRSFPLCWSHAWVRVRVLLLRMKRPARKEYKQKHERRTPHKASEPRASAHLRLWGGAAWRGEEGGRGAAVRPRRTAHASRGRAPAHRPRLAPRVPLAQERQQLWRALLGDVTAHPEVAADVLGVLVLQRGEVFLSPTAWRKAGNRFLPPPMERVRVSEPTLSVGEIP